jgi:Mg-chelatase subunit ChlD
VLLTETTRDPQFRAENYAYRSLEKNPVNGDEIRLIEGYPIPIESSIYSLISSTPEWHSDLGWVYHIYIPSVLYYGYESGRHGEIYVGDGTYLNIRAFYYAYADYRGPFQDNPFMLRITQESASGTDRYISETEAAFVEIAGKKTVRAKDPTDTIDHIKEILKKENGKGVDIVICIDTTGSMRPYIDMIRRRLISILQEITPSFESFRIGMVLYRDYNDEYLTRIVPFTANLSTFQRNLNVIRAAGGGDIPEAVYEGLHASATNFPWAAESRLVILIGDAPPHPKPRGKITKQIADDEISRQGIEVHAIVIPTSG